MAEDPPQALRPEEEAKQFLQRKGLWDPNAKPLLDNTPQQPPPPQSSFALSLGDAFKWTGDTLKGFACNQFNMKSFCTAPPAAQPQAAPTPSELTDSRADQQRVMDEMGAGQIRLQTAKPGGPP